MSNNLIPKQIESEIARMRAFLDEIEHCYEASFQASYLYNKDDIKRFQGYIDDFIAKTRFRFGI